MKDSRFSERLNRTPTCPGVYRMRSKTGLVLYVGKASNLRNRLRSYFTNSRKPDPKVRRLVKLIEDFDFIITESEQEALILECNLIKEYQPRFNSRLKDDKTYPFIKIDTSEAFPRVYITRNISKDSNSKYFGPFASAGSVRRTLGLLKKLFPYRSCTKVITGEDSRACLDYHIGRCVGPCIGAADEKEYGEVIDQVSMFLEGDTRQIVQSIKERMKLEAENLHFEKAAALRDQVSAIEKVNEGQKVLTLKADNLDIIGCSQTASEAWAEIFFVRQGKLIGRDNYLMTVGEFDDLSSVQTAFIKQFYKVTPYVPPTILTQSMVGEEKESLENFLKSKRGSRVKIITPIRGERKKLVNMVVENANQGMQQLRVTRFVESGNNDTGMIELQEALSLPEKPSRIECYDISNIQGTNAVGSMVVFQDGKPKPSDYRRFKIKTVNQVDDYSMMREMLSRRFKRLKEVNSIDTNPVSKATTRKDTKWTETPKLVLIDGGKGHLGAALQVFLELGINDVPLASLAKENEELFIPDFQEPIVLPRNSQGLYLVQRARDEAHRFAVTYHRKRRSKNTIRSSLDMVPGVGPKKRRQLLTKYGSVAKIRESSLEDIASTPGLTKKLAEAIKEYI
ncbi:MAG: excinuclease ABC subunit UvrC [SAR202 cluster bacterium]|jgi:excinuclease ABC subunit C|nr:MAG: excinuclease ABC subunit UvrC [SAR202 cluster bacterium]